MGFQNFPSRLLFKTIDTGEEVNLTQVDFNDKDTRLRYARLWFLLVGSAITTERFRINIRSRWDGPAIATSDWADLSEISNVAANWMGWLRFDFDDQNIERFEEYYLTLESDNYTRNGDTFYVGVKLETPFAVNEDVTDVDHSLPIAVELYEFD